MNIIFLCSLICLSSSSVLNQLAPLKKIMNKSLITIAPLKKIANKQLIDLIIDHQKDPAYLLSVLSNVDPTQLNAVIVLIRALLADSESDLTALNLASNNANTAYTDATVAYDSAVLARSRFETAYTDDNVRRETAYTAQSAVLDQQVNELFVVQTEAHGAKTNAQGTLDTEKIRLNGEVETLKQVITLLEGLGGSTSAPVLTLGSPNKISNADCFTACNGNVAVPQSVEETNAMRLLVKGSDPIQIWVGLKNSKAGFGGEWKRNDVLYTGWTNWKFNEQNTGELNARMLFQSGQVWDGKWFGIWDGELYCICQG